ncbi:50S ribosomal protein L11 [Candidatus Woesearchaeota archaeon]|nr:50S ribosomal protein L11 [Candidatus Woesearchaeota archaeon]
MAKDTVEALIEGGKATAAPPLGPALGPMGLNIGQVIADINKKTAGFKGMQVPVKIIIDKSTKEYTITVGTPPASALILKEAHLEKGSGNPTEFVADVRIENIIKVAKMKEDALLGKDLKQKIKEIMGTCDSMGVMIEGKRAREAIKDVDAGRFDKEIKEEKTELSAEEVQQMEDERKKLEEEIKHKRAEFEATAKSIISSMEGKSKSEIRSKLKEAKIPLTIINELAPEEKKAAEGDAKPAAAPKK